MMTCSICDSQLEQVLKDLGKLQSSSSRKRWFGYADDTLKISGFEKKIQAALNILQVKFVFTRSHGLLAQFRGDLQLETLLTVGVTVDNIEQAQIATGAVIDTIRQDQVVTRNTVQDIRQDQVVAGAAVACI
jgi:hypothetical protein